ncbi:MAG: aminotransferase class IV [Holophaga sp.]|jgi:branched-chain amino acid aminotransferase
MSDPRIWYHGRILDAREVGVGPLAPVLHYGLGVFEGIRAYGTPAGPAIFRLEEHMERMARGAAALGLDFDPAECARGCREVLADSGLQDAYIRPLTFFALGNLTLDMDGHTSRTLVAAIPWRNHLGDAAREGIRAHVSPMRRNAAPAIPPLKLCGGYVNSVLAKREASRAGFQEAIFQDDRGFVVEATGENVFLVKGGKVVAVEHPNALPGITRATIIELAGAEARPARVEELLDADEVFLTGTSGEVAPLCALDRRTWRPGPVGRELAARYDDLVHGRVPERKSWLTVV